MKHSYQTVFRHIKTALAKSALLACGIACAFFAACEAADGNPPPGTAATPAVTAAPVTPTAEPTPIPTTPPEQPAPEATPTPPPVQTQAAFIGQAVCTADESVNIREAADKASAVLGTLPAGETVDVIAYEKGWAHVAYKGVTGYVSDGYLIGRHQPSVAVPSGDWALRLVNPSHPLPDGHDVALADFEGGQVDARIHDICRQMFADAKADGVTFKLVDAYRSYELQNKLYQQKVDSYTAKGMSRGEAEAQAATITARPNTSEHQTGLALDIVTPSYTKRDKGFAKTDAFKWLDANAQDYGFTLRYQSGKQGFTGVIYEPWHWRFVGVQAATAMKKSGECLEEYTGQTD